MRSHCTNVTDKLKTVCEPFPRNSSLRDFSNCTVTLPPSNVSAWYVPSGPLLSPYIVNTINAREAAVYINSNLSVIQYIAPRADLKLVTQGMLDHKTRWEATECVLEPVVRRFRATVKENSYSDETLATWTNPWIQLPSSASAGWYLTPPASWWPSSSLPNNTNTQYSPESSFVFEANAITSIDAFLRSIFSGQTSRSMMDLVFAPASTAVYGGLSLYAGSDVLQTLGMGNITGCSDILADRLSCAMSNVAAAMTKTMRDSAYIADPATAAMASGSALVGVVYIAVHWQWLVLPLVVWALGATLVVGALVKTRRTGVPGWRNDTLPLLFLYRTANEQEETALLLGRDPVTARLYRDEQEGRTVLRRTGDD